MNNTNNVQKLHEAMKENAPWGSIVKFLDTINSLEEFSELIPILNESKSDLIEFYQNNLCRWENPELPNGFQDACPLLTKRLDTPQKIRILLRGADFRNVSPLLIGEVLEDILHRHEVKGEQVVFYERYRGDSRCDALRIVYHTQIQARTLSKLALCAKNYGTSSRGGLYIDWRPEEERRLDNRLINSSISV